MFVYLFRFLQKSRTLVHIVVSAGIGDPATLGLYFHLLCPKNHRLASPRAVRSLNRPKILQESLLVQLRLYGIEIDGRRWLNHGQGSESAASPTLVLVYGRVLQVQVDVFDVNFSLEVTNERKR